jgi:hypothetical protein
VFDPIAVPRPASTSAPAGRHPAAGQPGAPGISTRGRIVRWPAGAFLVTVILLLCALPRMGGGSAAWASPALSCPVVVDDAGAEAFLTLAARIQSGQDVPETKFARLCQQRDYKLWLESQSAKSFNPTILSRVMSYVYAPGQTDSSGQKVGQPKPKRRDLLEHFTFLRDHADSVTNALTRLQRGRIGDRILRLLNGYLTREQLPDTLTIAFVVAIPEVRYWEKHLLVDAGLASAADPDILCQILASVLYRDLAAAKGPEPAAASTGEEALRSTFSRLMVAGVAAWLEDYPHVVLRTDHPLLQRPSDSRLTSVINAPEVMNAVNRYLKIVLQDSAHIQDQRTLIDDVLTGGSSYSAFGYAMSALIVARAGEDGLRACSHSAADFLASYQKGAKERQVIPFTGPWHDLAKTLEDMPPITDPEYEALHAILAGGNAPD